MTLEEALTASEAARLLGVAVTTLRTWDRRYGLGPRRHEPGRHRRYDAEDLRRLGEMQRLVGQGVPPARAAAWVLDRGAAGSGVGVAGSGLGVAGSGRGAAGSGRGVAGSGRDGGGRAVGVGSAGPAVRGLTRAAMRLDATELRGIIGDALAGQGVVGAWTDLLAPALIHIGRKHAATRALVEVEHLLSTEVSAALARINRPAVPARILLACADEEQHSLALEALAAALAERGVATKLLGARVPPLALRDAVRRAGPDVVAVWSQTPETADPALLADLGSARPAPKLVLAAGPGWSEVPLPPGTVHPGNLPDALHEILG